MFTYYCSFIARKVSKYGFISGPYFLAFGLNTEILRISPNAEKYGPEITPYWTLFHAFIVEERLFGNLGVNDASSLTNEEFIEYYKKQNKVEFEDIVEQFGRIHLTTIHCIKEAEKTSNKSKNRYFDIVPYDNSCVKLQSKRNNYISAN